MGVTLPEMAHLIRHPPRQRGREYEKDGDDSIDDGHLEHVEAQALHVQVQIRVEDRHGGRLEEEDELDPDQVSHSEVVEDPLENCEQLLGPSRAQVVGVVIIARSFVHVGFMPTDSV